MLLQVNDILWIETSQIMSMRRTQNVDPKWHYVLNTGYATPTIGISDREHREILSAMIYGDDNVKPKRDS